MFRTALLRLNFDVFHCFLKFMGPAASERLLAIRNETDVCVDVLEWGFLTAFEVVLCLCALLFCRFKRSCSFLFVLILS